jgi:hypothetical protein
LSRSRTKAGNTTVQQVGRQACFAIASHLTITTTLSDRFTHGKLIEINSHSLFSKWFSESGKLVQKLFAKVTELVEEEGGFVVVLIGELLAVVVGVFFLFTSG